MQGKTMFLIMMLLIILIAPVTATEVSGEFISLESSDEAHVGSAAYLAAVFENTGQVPVSAQFNADVYFEGLLIQTIESQTTTVSPNKQVKFEIYFVPDQPGLYTVKGYITYDNYKTDTKEVQLSAKPSEMPLGLGVFPVLFIFLAIIVLWHFIKYPVKGKKKPKLFSFPRK